MRLLQLFEIESTNEIKGFTHTPDSDRAGLLNTHSNHQMVEPKNMKTISKLGEYSIKIDQEPKNDEIAKAFAYINSTLIGGAVLYMVKGYVRIASIWIEPAHRNNGIMISLYRYLLNNGYILVSDTTQSQYARHIWKNLSQEYPTSIGYSKPEKTITSQSEFNAAYDDSATRLFLGQNIKLLTTTVHENIQFPKSYQYITNSAMSNDVSALKYMQENAREITYREFIEYVSETELEEFFQNYDWDNPNHLSLEDNQDVIYNISWYQGNPAVFIVRSDIEYIWAQL